MKKSFNYTLFLFLVLSFYILKVNARVDNNGDWIWDYCTYTLNDDDTSNRLVNITACNFASASDLTEISVPATVRNSNGNTYHVQVNGPLFRGTTNNVLKKVTFKTGTELLKGDRLFDSNGTIETVIFEKDIKTTNLQTLLRAFTNCDHLSKIDFGNLDVSHVKDFGAMLQTTTAMQKIDLSMLNNASAESMEGFINTDNFREIKLGKNFNFNINNSFHGTPFGRGTWVRKEDGKEFSAVDIAFRTSTEDMSGTYTKVSNISYEIVPTELVTYSIKCDKPFQLVSSSSRFHIGSIPSTNLYFLYAELDDNGTNFVLDNATDKAVLLVPDAATDKDGNKYDLQVTIDNIILNNSVLSSASTTGKAYFEFVSFNKNGLNFYNSAYDTTDVFTSAVSKPVILNRDGNAKYDVTFKVVDKQGNPVQGSYLFSAYDIDVPAYGNTSDESYITPGYGYGDDSEGVNLYKGSFDLSTFLKAKTYSSLKITRDYSSNIAMRITGSRPDVMSEMSEFVVKANSESAKVQFTFGRNAGITVMSYYQPKIVRIENRNDFGQVLLKSHFVLKNNNGDTIEEWDTEDTPKSFFLNPGKYTITQISVKDGYPLAQDTVFYVDTLDTMIVNGETTNENLITIINAKDSEVGGKCRSEKIDGKWHYYDTKGNEITKDEWPNKCQDPVPTGSQIPFVAIISGAVLVVLTFIIVKKKTKIKTI